MAADDADAADAADHADAGHCRCTGTAAAGHGTRYRRAMVSALFAPLRVAVTHESSLAGGHTLNGLVSQPVAVVRPPSTASVPLPLRCHPFPESGGLPCPPTAPPLRPCSAVLGVMLSRVAFELFVRGRLSRSHVWCCVVVVKLYTTILIDVVVAHASYLLIVRYNYAVTWI